jgi:phosphohistidine phosphatase
MADPSDLLVDRTLLLLRHAKAVAPESFGGPDIERPLAKRGRADAAAAGRWLAGQEFGLDLVLCSTSVRTRQTWEHTGIADAGDVWYDRRLYNADPDDLLEVVRETPAAARTVLLIGHAPGVPWLADELAAPGDSPARNRMHQKYPTSGVAVLRHTKAWADLAPGDAELLDFVVPRG